MSLFLADCLKISILDYSLNYKEIYRLISESIFKGLLEEKVQAEEVACITQEENALSFRERKALGNLGISKSLPNSGANSECTKSHIAYFHCALRQSKALLYYAIVKYYNWRYIDDNLIKYYSIVLLNKVREINTQLYKTKDSKDGDNKNTKNYIFTQKQII